MLNAAHTKPGTKSKKKFKFTFTSPKTKNQIKLSKKLSSNVAVFNRGTSSTQRSNSTTGLLLPPDFGGQTALASFERRFRSTVTPPSRRQTAAPAPTIINTELVAMEAESSLSLSSSSVAALPLSSFDVEVVEVVEVVDEDAAEGFGVGEGVEDDDGEEAAAERVHVDDMLTVP